MRSSFDSHFMHQQSWLEGVPVDFISYTSNRNSIGIITRNPLGPRKVATGNNKIKSVRKFPIRNLLTINLIFWTSKLYYLCIRVINKINCYCLVYVSIYILFLISFFNRRFYCFLKNKIHVKAANFRLVKNVFVSDLIVNNVCKSIF